MLNVTVLGLVECRTSILLVSLLFQRKLMMGRLNGVVLTALEER
jgi:hypothetical protein